MENPGMLVEPANYYSLELIFDIDFHPSNDIIVSGELPRF